MPKSHKLGIHLFRRDYRLDDNLALLEACKECDSIIPVFVFTYDQIRDCQVFFLIQIVFYLRTLK